jgi:hypothetical protein
MNTHISEMITNCTECQIYGRKNTSEPLQPHQIPTRPWQKIGTDLFTHEGTNYLVIVDYASGYPELLKMSTTSSNAVITAMKSVFARYGVPDVVMSDNGPQYIAKEFADFANDWDFKHVTSSPHYPQSNGMAESTVKAMKNIVKKSKDVYKALLSYRTTPLQHGYSPAKIMMGRNLKGTLPIHPSRLTTDISAEFTEDRRRQHETQKMYYDKGKKSLSELKAGDPVRIQDDKTGRWATSAIIKNVEPQNRSYTVQTTDGAQYRRNRIHLKPQNTGPLPTTTSPQIVSDPPPIVSNPPHIVSDPPLIGSDPPLIGSDPPQSTGSVSLPDSAPQLRRSNRVIKRPARLIEN